MVMKKLSRMSLSWCPWAATLSLLLLWGAGCSEVKSAGKEVTPSAPAVSVTVIQVTPRTIPIYNEYTGTTDATETAEIRARVDGFIEQRLFDAGQLVKAKELLYVLDQRTYRAELQKAKAKVAQAEAAVQFAKEGVEVLRAESRLAQSKAALVKADQDVARYRPLVRQEAAPQIDLDSALAQQQVLREEMSVRKAELDQTKLQQRTQIALAVAELAFAQASQRLAELNLDYTEIKAPVNGRIGESNIFVGGLATANSTNPLTLLSPLDPIQVKVKIGEREYINYIQRVRARGRTRADGQRTWPFSSCWRMATPTATLVVFGLRIAPSTHRPALWKSPWISPTRTSPCCRARSAASAYRPARRAASSWCRSARSGSYRECARCIWSTTKTKSWRVQSRRRIVSAIFG